MKLQENHDKLLCTHESLVASHTELEIAHEVIVITIKSYEPRMDKGTHSLHSVDLTCACPINSSTINSISNDELSIISCCTNVNPSPSFPCDIYYI